MKRVSTLKEGVHHVRFVRQEQVPLQVLRTTLHVPRGTTVLKELLDARVVKQESAAKKTRVSVSFVAQGRILVEASKCSSCPAGHFSTGGKGECEACPSGF